AYQGSSRNTSEDSIAVVKQIVGRYTVLLPIKVRYIKKVLPIIRCCSSLVILSISRSYAFGPMKHVLNGDSVLLQMCCLVLNLSRDSLLPQVFLQRDRSTHLCSESLCLFSMPV